MKTRILALLAGAVLLIGLLVFRTHLLREQPEQTPVSETALTTTGEDPAEPSTEPVTGGHRPPVPCSQCGGSGYIECTKCSGCGYLEKRSYGTDPRDVTIVRELCYHCMDGTLPCSACKGTGRS